jgi:hypothetical protein
MYKNGDYARTSKYKHIFEKRYENNWGDEFLKSFTLFEETCTIAGKKKWDINVIVLTFNVK